MYGMLSGGQQHRQTVHGVSMFQQQDQAPHLLSGTSGGGGLSTSTSNIFFRPGKPCSSLFFNTWELDHTNTSSTNNIIITNNNNNSSSNAEVGLEPTSVLDLRSPSPNNSRALSASSSSATNSRKPVSSSSSSDCNNKSKLAAPVDASSSSGSKVKPTSTTNLLELEQQQQQQQSFNSSSSPGDEQHHHHRHQPEQQQEELVAGVGYGLLPLLYSAQGIRPVENSEESHDSQWLQEILAQQQQQQQHQESGSSKHNFLQELESELLSSSSPAVAAQQDHSSFMRWFEDPPAPAPVSAPLPLPPPLLNYSGAPEIEGLLPPWQQHQQQQQMMMMVKQEHQPQPSSTSLHPHLAHLDSFTRRTLPLVSSSHDVLHHHQQPPLYPLHFQEQPPVLPFPGGNTINLLWQQQQQQQHQSLPFQLQEDDPHHLFGSLDPNTSLTSQLQLPLPLLHHHHHHQVRDSKQPLSHRILVGAAPEEHKQLMLPIKRELHQFDSSSQSSKKLPRTGSSTSLHRTNPITNTEDNHWCSSSSGSAFVSRLLLRAAEACESGQQEHGLSILARLNDHHQHHHSLQHHPGSAAIGLLFREVLSDRLSGKLGSFNSSFSTSSIPLEIVERVQACKSLCEASKLLRFAHFVPNQAIAELLENQASLSTRASSSVHILDLSEAGSSYTSNPSFGSQWSSLIASTLQEKLPGPITIRITLVSTRPQALWFAIASLQDLARDYSCEPGGAEFEFHGIPTRPGEPLALSEMGIRPNEPLIVNFVLGLHKLVPTAQLLNSLRGYNPKLVLLVEPELEPKSSFLARFKAGLEYYTALAESMASEDWSREDGERVERLVWKPEIEELLSGELEHQKLEQWKLRMAHAGLIPSKLSDMCDKLANSLSSSNKNGSASSHTGTSSSPSREFEIVKDDAKDDASLVLKFRGKHLVSASAWKSC